MRILLIGATSYVASYFAEECVRRGWDVFAVVRDRVRHEILSVSDGDGGGVVPLDLGSVKSIGSVDAIVNFAFPKDVGETRIHYATRRLIERTLDAARELSPRVVVQVSTQSVFGYSFAREPRPVPVRWAVGDRYIETKALAEWFFTLKARRAPYVKVVLRLGNVLGPGAHWIAELARRILFEEPVGRGVSNATYVRNVADYICHLVSVDPDVLRGFGTFHHLAEFSSHRWPSIAEPLAAAMGLRTQYRNPPGRLPAIGARSLLRTGIRYSAMLFPEAVQSRIDDLQEWRRFRRFPPVDAQNGDSGDDPAMHQATEFSSHTLPGWSPKYDMATMLGDVVAWVRGSGYVAPR